MEQQYSRAWQYFEYHAKQRIDTFKFYITFSTFLMGSVFAVLDTNILFKNIITIAILCILILFSVLFWFLDKRNRDLIEIAKKTIIEIEANQQIDEKFKIFTKAKKEEGIYKKVFCLIFSIFIILSLLSIIFICYNF